MVTMGMLNISPAMLRKSTSSNTGGGRGASGHPHHEHVRVAGQEAVVLIRVPQGVTAYGAQRAPGPPLHRLREVRPEALCDLAQRGAGARVPAGGEGHVEDVRLARGQLEPEAAG